MNKPGLPLASSDLDRKRAESDALFLSIGEGAIATDEQGRISRVNQAALDILRQKEEELVGKIYQDVIVAEDENGKVLPPAKRPITKALATRKPVSTRLTYRRGDGSKVVAFLTVSVVTLEGEAIGAIQVFRDISHDVELERAKDEFISLASHQLRTPASAVKQYAGMLLQGYVGTLTEQQTMMLENIYESNERQITIVNDLLRVAQVDAGKVKPKMARTDLTPIVRGVISDLASKFSGRHQTVSYLGPETSLYATADSNLLRMVVENIVDNASKYTPKGKSITIDLFRLKKTISIVVHDEGVGIDEKDIPQMFQKFARVPNPLSDTVGGTGLGLYWAKKIIDLHHGEIRVNSKPRKGTIFTIHIPVEQEANGQTPNGR